MLYIFGIAPCLRVFLNGDSPEAQQYLSNEGVRDWRSGFIGSHLVSRLLESEKTERMVVYDNFTSGQRSYLQGLTSDRRSSVVEADLKDAGRVCEAMAGCDTVFHLAANPDIAKAVTQPDIDFWKDPS